MATHCQMAALSLSGSGEHQQLRATPLKATIWGSQLLPENPKGVVTCKVLVFTIFGKIRDMYS